MDTRSRIGNVGEEIVVEQIKGAIRTDDWWDSEKDGTIGSERYEVKTIRLNRKTQSFWQSGNLKKLDEVDRFYIIRVPMDTEPLSVCALYVVENHRECFNEARRNDGGKVRAYPLTSCKKLVSMDNDTAKFLRDNSSKISTLR